MTKPSLTQKIFRISREADLVKRNGVGENNGNESRPLYAYPRIEDVLAVVQPLLNKYKLIATGSVVKEPVTHVIRGGAATTEMLVEWTLEDSDTKESRTWRIPGMSVRRHLVWERCGGFCEAPGCNRNVSEETMHTHHIKPRSKGGAENLDNLEALCGRCHGKKHSNREPKWTSHANA